MGASLVTGDHSAAAAADQPKVATLATLDCPKRTTLPERTDETQILSLRWLSLNEAQARKPSNFDNIFSRFIISSKICIKENV